MANCIPTNLLTEIEQLDTDVHTSGDNPLLLSSGMAQHIIGINALEIIKQKYKLGTMGLFVLARVYSSWDTFKRPLTAYAIDRSYLALGDNQTAITTSLNRMKELQLVQYHEAKGRRYWMPTNIGVNTVRSIFNSISAKDLT